MTTKILTAAAALGAALALGAGASAQTIPYPAPGTYNATAYTFTAAATGDVIGYSTGNSGSFTKDVGLLVNGVLTSAGYGLNSSSTAFGDSFDFGSVTAGDTLTFVLDTISVGKTAYSDPSMNTAYDDASDSIGHNHVYSTIYDASTGIFSAAVPTGVYIGFEDLPFPGSDFNYVDETFVVTGVTVSEVSAAPEPSTWALLIAGVAAIGFALRRRPRLSPA